LHGIAWLGVMPELQAQSNGRFRSAIFGIFHDLAAMHLPGLVFFFDGSCWARIFAMRLHDGSTRQLSPGSQFDMQNNLHIGEIALARPIQTTAKVRCGCKATYPTFFRLQSHSIVFAMYSDAAWSKIVASAYAAQQQKTGVY
jgi:hypothetical protein